jgi:hypothetical protein
MAIYRSRCRLDPIELLIRKQQVSFSQRLV